MALSSDRHSHNSNKENDTTALQPGDTYTAPVRRTVAPKVTPLNVVNDCPSQWVQWIPGSVWETYPFRLHKSADVCWKPIEIDEDGMGVVMRAKNCQRKLQEVDGDYTPCTPCQRVPHSIEFKVVVERAQHVQEHTPWLFLTDLQKEGLLRQMAATIRRLRTQVCNLWDAGVNFILH